MSKKNSKCDYKYETNFYHRDYKTGMEGVFLDVYLCAVTSTAICDFIIF